MRTGRRWWSRILGLFGSVHPDPDIADEFQSHVSMLTDDYIRSGMSPEDARRAALLKFGHLESVKEEYRDQRGIPVLESFAQDVRFAARSFAKRPGLYGRRRNLTRPRHRRLDDHLHLAQGRLLQSPSRCSGRAQSGEHQCQLQRARWLFQLVRGFHLHPRPRGLVRRHLRARDGLPCPQRRYIGGDDQRRHRIRRLLRRAWNPSGPGPDLPLRRRRSPRSQSRGGAFLQPLAAPVRRPAWRDRTPGPAQSHPLYCHRRGGSRLRRSIRRPAPGLLDPDAHGASSRSRSRGPPGQGKLDADHGEAETRG